jgi:hypothetical protein
VTHKQAVAARVLSATPSLNSRVSRRIRIASSAHEGLLGDSYGRRRRSRAEDWGTYGGDAHGFCPVVHDSRRGKRLLSCLGGRSVEVSPAYS